MHRFFSRLDPQKYGLYSGFQKNRRLYVREVKESDMSVTLLDPTNEEVPVARMITPRPEAIVGKVALLDIAKRRSDEFLDRLQEAMERRLPQVEVNRYHKPTFSKPAPADLRREIKKINDFVVIGLAD